MPTETPDLKMMYVMRAVAWLRILLAVPRTVEEGGRRVQLPGMPSIALEAFADYWLDHDPAGLAAATDADGLLRTVPESIWHAWLASLIEEESPR